MKRKSETHRNPLPNKVNNSSYLPNFIAIKIFISRNIYSLLLIFLISVVVASHILYVLKTYQYPQWDENVYLQHAVDFLPILKNPSLNFWQNILDITQHRQPFYPLFISIPLLFLGTTSAYKTALFLNGLFYAVTIFFTYLTARQFFEKLPSFLASYMFAFYGFPLFYLHFTLEETAATAFATVALYFLIRASGNFSHKHILLFSLLASIGVLARWTTPIFLLGPFLLFLFIYFKKIISKKINKSHAVKTILILILVGVFPAAILYYYPNISYFLGYAEANRVGGPEWVPELIRNPFSKSSIIWYASVLAQQTIFFWILFLVGLSIAVMRFRKYSFLLLAFIIPYLFFTLGAVWKEDRFIVPSYPIMAIISAIVIHELRKKTAGVILIAFILILGLLNFLGASWGIGPMKFSIHGYKSTVPHSILLPMPIGHPRRVWLAPISWPPRPNEGNSDLILKTVLEDNKSNKKPNVLLTFTIPQIEGPLYNTVLYEQRDLINLRALWGFGANDLPTLFERIKNADYILIKEGGAFDDQFDDQPDLLQTFNESVRSSNAKLPSAFVKLQEIEVPFDKSKVVIYKKALEITIEDLEIFTNSFISENNN